MLTKKTLISDLNASAMWIHDRESIQFAGILQFDSKEIFVNQKRVDALIGCQYDSRFTSSLIRITIFVNQEKKNYTLHRYQFDSLPV